jgi:DNA ligase-1
LDGVRVICRVENGSIKFFSRQGKEFHTLDKVAVAINKVTEVTDSFVLDGELCIVNENGDEDFTSVIKEIRRKDHTIENPKFKVFDCLTLDEFDKGTSKRLLRERIDDINWKIGNYLWNSDFPIDRVELEECESEDDVVLWLDHATECGWEGIMLRKDDVYKGKRSNDILKVKKMHDEEYVVKDIEYGPFRIIDKELKKEVTIQTMTNVIIEHKGNPVSVGSGFTIDDRNHYYNNPSDIVGKEITVQYFEESQDKTGKYSLRFPVCKTVYENGRQV